MESSNRFNRHSYIFILFLSFILASPSQGVRFDTSSKAAFVRDCRIKIQVLSALSLERFSTVWMTNEARTRHQIDQLKRLPKRDLGEDTLVQEFLANHKVYISLTTSPKRIEQIHHVLATLPTEHIARIFLTLPETFGRDGTTYKIPNEIKRNQKVQILTIPVDLGPATKMIPAIEYVQQMDPEALVISIDDDHGYPNGMVNELITASVHAPGSVVSGIGQNVDFWAIPDFPLTRAIPRDSPAPGLNYRPVDVVEGFSAIAYPAGIVNTKLVRQWLGTCQECRMSDDLVISLALAKGGVPRYHIESDLHNRTLLRSFDYGFEEDALHRGGGLDSKTPRGFADINAQKYRVTAEALRYHFLPIRAEARPFSISAR